MLFNSYIFLVFAAVFFLIWPLTSPSRQTRWAFITAASFFFYGWWDWRFIFLIIASGMIDFTAALLMEKYPDKKKTFLILSVCGNIGGLAVFKYLSFLTENGNALFGLIGADYAIPIVSLTLPIGISFYTFQSMSYTIDVYKDDLKPTKNLLHFFSYLSMFPQLVAGPIVRAKDLLPQLDTVSKSTPEMRWNGLQLVARIEQT